MQKSKHTPGPWQWDEPSNWHGLDARVWVCEPYGVVAQVPIEAWRPKSVGRANAALIAAAPEMYEAICQMLDMEREFGQTGKAIELMEKARAKAEGK